MATTKTPRKLFSSILWYVKFLIPQVVVLESDIETIAMQRLKNLTRLKWSRFFLPHHQPPDTLTKSFGNKISGCLLWTLMRNRRTQTKLQLQQKYVISKVVSHGLSTHLTKIVKKKRKTWIIISTIFQRNCLKTTSDPQQHVSPQRSELARHLSSMGTV